MATTTKQPSTAAMEAAREMMPLVKGVFLPASQYGAGQVLAAIIDRHLSAERQEVREVLRALIGSVLDLSGGEPEHEPHNDSCYLCVAAHNMTRAESLLARMGGE